MKRNRCKVCNLARRASGSAWCEECRTELLANPHLPSSQGAEPSSRDEYERHKAPLVDLYTALADRDEPLFPERA